MQREAFPAVLIDQAEDAQSSAIVGAVGHEVPTPDVIEPLGPRRDHTGGTSSSSGTRQPPFHTQSAVAPQALHQLFAHLPALGFQQSRELAVTQTWMFSR